MGASTSPRSARPSTSATRSPRPETDTNLGNYQGDTFAQANPTGSSAGIGSLNGNPNSATTDAGTIHPVNYTCAGTGDRHHDDRAERRLRPLVACAEDDRRCIAVFGERARQRHVLGIRPGRHSGDRVRRHPRRRAASPGQPVAHARTSCSTSGTAQAERAREGVCAGATSSRASPALTRGNVDIVPWGLNASAGTFASFQSYIQNNASGVPVGLVAGRPDLRPEARERAVPARERHEAHGQRPVDAEH